MAMFSDDSELGYRARWRKIPPGEGFAFDEAYRLAHLPLVAPGHPLAVAALPGRDYRDGRHPPIWSLVLPVDGRALASAAPMRALDAALRAAPFAGKIAWDMAERRRERLHATVVGGLAAGEGAADPLNPASRAALAALPPFEVELRGLFSGDRNRGRLYLKAYPEKRGGQNMLHRVQDALGRPRADLYVVGLHNLIDPLGPAEAAALSALIEGWWDRPLLRWRVGALQLLVSRDDLALDSQVAATIALAG